MVNTVLYELYLNFLKDPIFKGTTAFHHSLFPHGSLPPSLFLSLSPLSSMTHSRKKIAAMS
jgi:hypothetical protein